METTLEVYQNAAGLLSRMGYNARAEAVFLPIGRPRPVVALVTDAPPVVVGYSVTIVAADPEAHLPAASSPAGRVPKGTVGFPPVAHFL